MVRYDGPNDIEGGLGGVAMPNHARALVKGRFEKFARELLLASFIDTARVILPHVGDENNVFQGRFVAKFAQQAEITSDDPAKPIVRDAVDADDPGKRCTFFISIDSSTQGARERRKPI